MHYQRIEILKELKILVMLLIPNAQKKKSSKIRNEFVGNYRSVCIEIRLNEVNCLSNYGKFNECSGGTSCLFPILWPISLFSLDSHLVQSNSIISAFRQLQRSLQCCHPETLPFVAHELCVPSIHIASASKDISRWSIGY